MANGYDPYNISRPFTMGGSAYDPSSAMYNPQAYGNRPFNISSGYGQAGYGMGGYGTPTGPMYPGAQTGYMQQSPYTSSLGQALMGMGTQAGMQPGATNPMAALLQQGQIDPNMLNQLIYPMMMQMAQLPMRKATTEQDIAARENIASKYGITKSVQEPLTGVSEQLNKMINDAMMSASSVAARSGVPLSSMAENLRGQNLQSSMRGVMSQALQQGPQNLLRFGQWLTG